MKRKGGLGPGFGLRKSGPLGRAGGAVPLPHDLGLWGEQAAAAHLQAKGWRVLGRRVRTRGGELDLVALDRDTLVFVEVKSASAPSPGGHPCEQVHAAKRRRLARAARCYLAGWDAPSPACRFDVVTVIGRERPLIEHFEGAFFA